MIRLERVCRSFDDGRTWAVRDVDLHVRKGELLVLVGASGCGKTTTLKMINRLVEPTSGDIEVDGEDTAAVDPVLLRRRIGYVFQRIGLFPHLTVGENVGVVPRLLGWDEADVAERTDELLALVGLEPGSYRDRSPEALSGGQQQRVGVARALAARTAIVLMDEPFGALDPVTRDRLQTEFRGIHDRLGLTTVLVTHDMAEALLMADRIAVMDAGRILRLDTPRALLSEPGDEVVSRLLDTPRRQADRIEALGR